MLLMLCKSGYVIHFSQIPSMNTLYTTREWFPSCYHWCLSSIRRFLLIFFFFLFFPFGVVCALTHEVIIIHICHFMTCAQPTFSWDTPIYLHTTPPAFSSSCFEGCLALFIHRCCFLSFSFSFSFFSVGAHSHCDTVSCEQTKGD